MSPKQCRAARALLHWSNFSWPTRLACRSRRCGISRRGGSFRPQPASRRSGARSRTPGLISIAGPTRNGSPRGPAWSSGSSTAARRLSGGHREASGSSGVAHLRRPELRPHLSAALTAPGADEPALVAATRACWQTRYNGDLRTAQRPGGLGGGIRAFETPLARWPVDRNTTRRDAGFTPPICINMANASRRGRSLSPLFLTLPPPRSSTRKSRPRAALCHCTVSLIKQRARDLDPCGTGDRT